MNLVLEKAPFDDTTTRSGVNVDEPTTYVSFNTINADTAVAVVVVVVSVVVIILAGNGPTGW